MEDTLLSAVAALLSEHPEGLSEWALLTALRQTEQLPPEASGDEPLALFRAHFRVMHALHRLADDAPAGQHLSLNPLCLRWHSAAPDGATLPTTDAAPAALRRYYLDWSNYTGTDADGVQSLLTGFWRRQLARSVAPEACAELGVGITAGWDEIVQAYRQLVTQHHPDHGGDAERFHRIRSAYETLKQRRPTLEA